MNGHFEQVCRLAAAQGLVNIQISDCQIVAAAYERFNVPIDCDFKHIKQRKRRILDLHNAYKRWLQSGAKP